MSEWPVVALGDVLTLEYGKGLPADDRCDTGKYPVYGANGEKGRTNRWLVDGPSVVVGRKGTAGAVTRVDGRFWPLDVTYFVACDPNIMDVDFLYYVLQKLELPSLARGVKPGINRDDVYGLKMTLPPLAEQKRIVARLDQEGQLSAHLKAHFRECQSLSRTLQEGVLTDLLSGLEGMKSQALSDIADIQSGFAFKSGEYAQRGHFLMRIRNVQDGYLTLSEPVYVDLRKESKLERFVLVEGDILVSLTGNIGRVGQVSPEHLPAALNQRVARLRARLDVVRPAFLLLVLRSPKFRDTLIDKGHGAAQANVSPKVLNDFLVPAISLDEQDAIVSDYRKASEQIAALRSIQARQQDLIAEFDASILRVALSGDR